MLKRLLFFLLAQVVSQLSYGQSMDDIKIPKVVPPSPDAAALGKYGQIPVNKSTGVPSIEIPLYEIKTPRFSLPVSLSYHASGIKVEEMASWVGAGWALNAGGMITRSIIGMADDSPRGYITKTIKEASQIQWPADMYYIADVVNRRIDTDPDNFFYNFNNHSGSFVFGDDKKPVLIPYQPIKIHFDLPTKNFDITDENGNIYYFNTQESVTSRESTYMSGVSTWYLTRMVSADQSDVIDFAYTTDVMELIDYSYSFTQSVGQSDPFSATEMLLPFEVNTSLRTFHPVRIQSIVFNGGKVEFSAKDGRLDNGNIQLDEVIVYNQDPKNNQYNRIKSFKLLTDYFNSGSSSDYYNQPVPAKDTHRLKLNAVQEVGTDNAVIKSHQFEYNASPLPHIHSFAQDRWGYFNGKTGNRSLLESQAVTINVSPSATTVHIGMDGFTDRGADRSVSPDDMQACVLNKITYPTGGYTRLNYDCNKYKYVGTVTSQDYRSAAARGWDKVNDVVDYTPTAYMLDHGGNIFTVKVGTVTNQPLAYIKVVRLPEGNEIYNSSWNWNYSNSQLSTIITLPLVADVHYQLIGFAQGGGFPNTFDPLAYATIATSYQVVTETETVLNQGGLRVSSIQNFNADGSIAGTETYAYGNDESGCGLQLAFPPVYKYNKNFFFADNSSLFRTVYSCSSIYPLSTFSSSPIVYPTVTLYHGNASLNTGKSVYEYDIYPDEPLPIFGMNINTVKPISVMWKNGEPKRERHFRNYGNNQYTLVQETINFFDLIPRAGGTGTTIWYTWEPIAFTFDGPTLGTDGYVYSGVGNVPFSQNHFSWFDYPISTGSRILKSSINSQYETGGTSISTTTQYYYDNLDHMFPTRVITTNSKGESFTKTTNYPQDMVLALKDPTGIYGKMATANIISPAIEQYKSKNTTQLLYEKTNYDFAYNTDVIRYNTYMIKPASIEMQTLSNPSEVRLQYLDYDTRGNVSTLVKDTGPKIGYRWGCNKKYPVAEVVNAASNEFYYEGFEENAAATLGNAQIGTHTGQYYYLGPNYAINWSLPNARNYVITYWYLNGSVWKYMPEQPFTGTITLNNGSGYDDIRIYPKDAQMKTYTYTSLLGITSETDASSRTTYYRYDNDCRLMDIRDQDTNIVKTFQYNYQQH